MVELIERIAAEANVFVDTLDDGRRQAALLPFDEAERRTWAYWPTQRRGVPMWSLDRTQAKAAHRLLGALLPVPAYTRAVTIMALDEVLDRLEHYRSDSRHAGDYWVSVFGSPDGDPAWGVRFEGHHVSVNATVGDGAVRLTPLFLGANPAVVRDGNETVTDPLGPEDRLGFELLHALTSEERASAVLSTRAPDDIVTRNQPALDSRPAVTGVALDGLIGRSASAARALLDVYLGRFPDGSRRPEPAQARFSWAGATEPGVGHYYRIAGPRLWIEFDNTQDGANHIHTVVRDPGGDFGADILAAHYEVAHTSR